MIKIICIGKIKESYLKDGINDYLNRIMKYTKIELIELIDNGINEEKENILKYLNPKDYLITLEIEGESLSSIELANKIDRLLTDGKSNITFIIGGSDGLHQDIKNLSNYQLSFSRFTFPHQLFRLILLEQIYRSFKIMKNESYHK